MTHPRWIFIASGGREVRDEEGSRWEGGRTAWEASRTTSLCPSTGSGVEETDRSGGKTRGGG